MDRWVLAKFRSMHWSFADRDPVALDELRHRIATAGRRRALERYTPLVDGVIFRLPHLHRGQPFEIHTDEWSDLERAVLAEFLGFVSLESYERHGFMASALVVREDDGLPDQEFWSLMTRLGVVLGKSDERAELFWEQQVRLAHEWYTAHPREDV